MNHWSAMLAALPTQAQRLIARTQRISLPRGADGITRHHRLRQALCHAATVRAVYSTLDPASQAALQDLRHRRGGIDPTELAQRYGPLRPWHHLTADPHPRTVTERLVLLGWLLPRPASRHHPPRFLLPPELRRWLPTPLALPDLGAAPSPGLPPALRAATTLLLAAAEIPLVLRADDTLRRTSQRHLVERLAPIPATSAGPLVGFVLPLVRHLGLLADHHGTCALTPAAGRFLDRPPADQLLSLRQAWLAAPQPDHWLLALLPNARGIDWPCLRRRLVDWAEALPAGRRLDPAILHGHLAAALGPLANAHTHGFRPVGRCPWQPARAERIFLTALRGPLAWLGLIAWPDDAGAAEPAWCARVADLPAGSAGAGAWHYGQPGELIVPHTHGGADLLHLLPVAQWQHADALATTYRLAPTALAAAAGEAQARCRSVVLRRAGPLPAAWRGLVDPPRAGIRLVPGPVVLADPPALLAQACRARSVRRHLGRHLAPGIALTSPDAAASLLRALAREQIAVAAAPSPPSPPPAALSPAECATLLVACATYRHHAPLDALPLPSGLEDRLRAALPTPLRAALQPLLAELSASSPAPAPPFVTAAAAPAASLPPPFLSPSEATAGHLARLRHAIAARRAVTITYDTGGRGDWLTRVVRPLALEDAGDVIYLRAFCTLRGAERRFRLDRIGTVQPAGPAAVAPSPHPHRHPSAFGRRRPATHQIVERVNADAAEADDLDPRHGRGVQEVAAHAVGVWIDEVAQRPLHGDQLLGRQVALKDAVLDVRAKPLEQLQHPRPPLVVDDIVADDREHPPLAPRVPASLSPASLPSRHGSTSVQVALEPTGG